MARDLVDKTVVITGASAGIGAATAVACAEAGMDLVLSARRADRLLTVAERVRRAGRRAVTVVADVSDRDTSGRLLDAAEQAFGRFDVVFANAGYGIRRSAADLEDPDLREIFEVNFFAANDLLREAARRLMQARRRGHLLMCSSCLARFSVPEYGAYCATKAAQAHICRAMRLELRPHKIDVASVHPITTSTEFAQVAHRRSGISSDEPGSTHDVPRFLIQPPERVARAVVACLRKPRPEVWTSVTVRCLAGATTVFPSLLDALMRRRAARTATGRRPGA
jgi:short-subunit dehydrogenase